MFNLNRLRKCLSGVAILFCCGICPVFGAAWKTLPGHVPDAVSHLTSNGLLPATNHLQLGIGLPLRDPAGLEDFLAQVYDPASPNFHHYLTPEEFTARFGPSEADYAAVEIFARTNGLNITATHGNRLLLNVDGPVSAVQKAFHITLRTYRHPTETRNFYAPDTGPTMDAQLPVADVSGLNNFSHPRPKVHPMKASSARPRDGSGGQGAYFANDFRAAYVPGTTLTGAGQEFGVLEFDGFYSNDIAAYESDAGITNIPIQTILIDGVNGLPGFSGDLTANDEVSLDIEMGMAMAPGLAKVLVFEGVAQNDILEVMAASNQVKQISCSWGWPNGPSTTTDNLFKELAAQGQSFFSASGDRDAYTVGNTSFNGVDNTELQNAPSSSPYITQVGGTELSTTGPGGAWAGETVWNSGYDSDFDVYIGSSGGVSSYYSIPSWQTNVNTTANGGSSRQRNIPDVALVADNILVYSENGQSGIVQGTSCSAPLWAGFTALVNQQAAAIGAAPMGLINQSLYRLARTATLNGTYANYFNDVTSGNNESDFSPTLYVAGAGYDLCTGLGTLAGTNLINGLISLENPLSVLPAGDLSASGMIGGQFSASTPVLVLTNTGSASLSWKIFGAPAWLTLAPTNGTIAFSNQASVTFGFNAVTTNLPVGNYSAILWFSNVTTHIAQSRPATLQVSPMVLPVGGFAANGPFGGPFSQNLSALTVTNSGTGSFDWFLINTSAWLNVSPTNGTLPATGDTAAINLSLSASSAVLPAKAYSATLRFTNLTSHASQLIPATLSIGQNLVENGGFETGDFTDWILVGDGESYQDQGLLIENAVVNSQSFTGASGYIHSGTNGAVLGEGGSLATLSQNIPTVPQANYRISFWLVNKTNVATEQFELNWDGNTIYNILNPKVFAWTNLNFVVTATDTNSVLQFAAESDQGYFGLDDISVSPIPGLDFTSVLRSTNTYKFTWGATTGLVYQVQYKTNLLQPDWINLNKSITARTNILSTADTNALLLSGQRFYRLEVLP